MMTVRNIEGISQIGDWLQHVVSELGMLLHDLLFGLRQFLRLEKNVIGNAHFPDIMQEGAAPDQRETLLTQSHFASQLQGLICDALSMTFCFSVTQVKGAGPAFEGR